MGPKGRHSNPALLTSICGLKLPPFTNNLLQSSNLRGVAMMLLFIKQVNYTAPNHREELNCSHQNRKKLQSKKLKNKFHTNQLAYFQGANWLLVSGSFGNSFGRICEFFFFSHSFWGVIVSFTSWWSSPLPTRSKTYQIKNHESPKKPQLFP